MVPRLPIPNRTVKRLSADDSVDYPCESRTPPNPYSDPLMNNHQGVLFYRAEISGCLKTILIRRIEEYKSKYVFYLNMTVQVEKITFQAETFAKQKI